jgi:hypothetical protein
MLHFSALAGNEMFLRVLTSSLLIATMVGGKAIANPSAKDKQTFERRLHSKNMSEAHVGSTNIFFFPYPVCLLFAVQKVRKHDGYWYHGDEAKIELTVKVKDVLRDETHYAPKQGDTLTLLLDSSTLRDLPMTGLTGKQSLWACSWWRIDPGKFHVNNVYEPFHDQYFPVSMSSI